MGPAQWNPLLVRLKGAVVLDGSRIAGSCPTVASWLPIPPHDLLLVQQNVQQSKLDVACQPRSV